MRLGEKAILQGSQKKYRVVTKAKPNKGFSGKLKVNTNKKH
jgi:hypothetical protein